MSNGELFTSSRPTAILQGLYHFNGNSNDSSSFGNNGTDSNMSYSNKKKFGSGAAYFNGTNAKITLGTTPDLTSDFTIMWWANADQIGSDVGTITKRDAFAGMDFQIFESSADSGQIALVVGGSNILTATGVSYVVGQWVHVAITRAGNVWTIYKNAVPFKSVTSATAMPTGDTWRLGVLGGDAAAYYKGSLDEFATYNGAWTYRQLKDYYAWSLGRFTKIL